MNNHAITTGDLLFSIGLLAGLLTAAFGLLSMFGNMMADAAGDGGKSGCITFIVGAAMIVGCGLALALL